MANRMLCVLMVASLLVLGGCSIAGTWKTVSVEPENMADQFMFSSVTFGDDGSYTATARYEGQQSTSTGSYEWTGTKLKIEPADSPPREYDGQLRMDGKLVLEHDHEGETMTAVMEKD